MKNFRPSKKIAFIFSQFPCYDETFILREMNQLRATRLQFTIYSLKTPQDKIIHDEAKSLAQDTVYRPFLSLGVIATNFRFFFFHPIKYIRTFHTVVFGHLKSPNFLIKTVALWPKVVAFAHLMQKNKVEHLHGQWATFPATAAMIISRLTDIPFSFTGHAHDIYLDTTMLTEKFKASRFVTTCTTDNKSHLEKILDGQLPLNKNKIIINYHGIDLERFSALEASQEMEGAPFHILSVGSLLECKGFRYLIDACQILKEKGLHFKCTIAGGGKLEDELRAQVTRLGLNKQVNLTGFITQDKLLPLYRHADIFVLAMVPEIHWGIPNVLVEAVAMGLPTVCTMLPSIPELIQDGETGLIIPPKDPQAIAHCIFNLHGNRALRDKLKTKGRAVVEENFDILKNTEQLKDMFLNN